MTKYEQLTINKKVFSIWCVKQSETYSFHNEIFY